MRNFSRFALTAFVVLVFAFSSFAMTATNQSSAAKTFGTIERPDGQSMYQNNELDEITTVFDFEVDNLDDWTWTNPRLQPSHWAADSYMPHSGTNSWRPFDATLGDNGGYLSTWYQDAMTPEMDLTGTESPSLSFWFRLNCEPAGGEPTGFDGWDGANFWISYTDGDDVHQMMPVTDFTGPDYDSESLFGFGFEWFWGTGIPGWGGAHDTWSEVTMDLSAYTAYTDVQIHWIFASDPSYDTSDLGTMYGYQVDDIAVMDGDTEIFADGAEDPDNTEMIFSGGAPTNVESEFGLLDGQADAPSPTKVLDLDNQTHGYEHALESPAFDLPELGEGESLIFDIYVNSDMAYASTDTYYASWSLEIWDPEEETWWNVNDIRNSNAPSSYVGPTSAGWTRVTEGFGSAIWDGSMLAGLNGVKARVIFTSPNGDYEFNYLHWDNFMYEVSGVEHDISCTNLDVPYPVAVGLANPGTVLYSNNGINDESFIAFWGVNSATLPGIPGPTIDLAQGESVVMTIDSQDTSSVGWVPAEAISDSVVSIIARSSLATDEDPSNNADTVDVYVNQSGEYEFGYDAHTPYYVLTYNNTGTGPMEHFVLDQTNPYFTDHSIDVNTVAVLWGSRTATRPNWPAAGVPFNIHVFAGGDTPGAELASSEVTVSIDDTHTNGWAIMDVSGVEALQGMTGGDFYVWVELTTTVTDGTTDWPQPSIFIDEDISGEVYPDNNLYYDGTDASGLGYASFIHILAADTPDAVGGETGNVIPARYALDEAYPNPFNPTTTLRYDVARTGKVTLNVFNIMGQQVATLVNNQVQAGSHKVTFDASSLSSGIYFVRMQADGFTATRKVMLMK